MRRLITSISMIVLAIVFYQCSTKSGKVSVGTNQQDTLQSLNDNIIQYGKIERNGNRQKDLAQAHEIAGVSLVWRRFPR